eukprot:TRINITY_DN10621_c0_g4_i2.p2 TRINITY_DN10621_c0_g4~~TRINITY_DN10621_c0_g4_i2.p2  ORF type:complete len:478 (+),score=125.62 TRINITY_DN10621_c0_g4_i2:1124-2557(+)
MAAPLAAVLLASTRAAVPADRVHRVPGFSPTSFAVYSGYLKVPGPFVHTDYDELQIHYQLDCSQRSQGDPVVVWHQGGPGASSVYGLYGEMGYFQASERGLWVNEHAWNNVANMLYLESPAGSGLPIGFSTCSKGNETQSVCSWDDTSQGEAYVHTLAAFFKAFPEFKDNDMFLAGESYAGQFIPNIAHYALTNPSMQMRNLKGIALGNACWGGDETSVLCNGPNEMRMDVDFFYRKGMLSQKLRDRTYCDCGWSECTGSKADCDRSLDRVDAAIGPHNVYNVYDNCDETEKWVAASGRTSGWLRRWLRANIHLPDATHRARAFGGGYDWACGSLGSVRAFFEDADVQRAMHLKPPFRSNFTYNQSGPASRTLYPSLAKKVRILVYNGDADSCVPYTGNEEWTSQLSVDGVLVENRAWHPWYGGTSTPAGYATTYNVTGASTDFTFATLRLGGHMVATYRPAASMSLIDRFISGRQI